MYVNDPYISETYFPWGYSQLTSKGKETELQIGRFIRANYGELIPTQYTPNIAYAISTNWKRTKMSLELVLSGLFPPLVTDVFDSDLTWQPIPFNIENGQGLIGVASLYCPNYISAYYNYVLSKEAQDIRAPYASLYEKLSQYSGNYVQLPRDAAGIYFALKSEDDYGLSLPSWTSEYYPGLLEQLGSVDYEYSTATPTLKKLSAGFLLKKILDDSFAKQNGTLSDERKIFLYSAHEWNVATMLRALNVFYRHIPPFGATVFFEIHNVNGVYGLKVRIFVLFYILKVIFWFLQLYYQNYESGSPFLLTIPGCTDICPLEQVAELLKDSIPGPNDVCTYTSELA